MDADATDRALVGNTDSNTSTCREDLDDTLASPVGTQAEAETALIDFLTRG